MNNLPQLAIKSSVLLLLAVCVRPACGGSASAAQAGPAPAMPAPPQASTAAPAPRAAGRDAAEYAAQRLLQQLQSTPPRTGLHVLVVPAQQMDGPTFDRIVEDLSVMSRILEKSLPDMPEATTSLVQKLDIYGGGGAFYTGDPFSRSGYAGPLILRSASGRPKSLYIGGYGAVFSFQVNVPLVPPPEASKQDQTAGPADPVWAEAQRELVDPQGAARMRHVGPEAQTYKAEVVEELKSGLTAALQHATNIRDLSPESWLTVLVQGPSAVPGQAPDLLAGQALDPTGVHAARRTLLTLRAKKADIDQYAKGQLDETQFRQRVQSATY